MTCSVVIPCFNGAALTRACIESLLQQSEPVHEILVVDNASSDATAQLADEFGAPVTVLRQPENRGFAGGVNAGIAVATGDEVLILNNDTLAAGNLVSELRRALRAAPDIGAAAPVSNCVKGEALLAVGHLGKEPAQRQQLAAALSEAPVAQDVDTLAGLCLLLRRSTLAEVGVFDERFGHGNYEDDDLCLRLRLRGYRLVIARRAFLHHEGHATFRSMGLDLGEELRKRLQQFHAKWHRHPAGLATLASLYGDARLAAAAAEEALRRCPDWLDATLHLGRYHEREGDAEAAVTHLSAFLSRCPEHVGAMLQLGLALLRCGRREEGRAQLDRTVARHRLTPAQTLGVFERLGQLALGRGEHAAALQHFSDAATEAPEHAEAHHGCGLALLALDRVGEARDAFRRACELGHALAHTNLGICRHRLGDESGAMASFTRAVELLPEDPVARSNYEAGLAAGMTAPGDPVAARS